MTGTYMNFVGVFSFRTDPLTWVEKSEIQLRARKGVKIKTNQIMIRLQNNELDCNWLDLDCIFEDTFVGIWHYVNKTGLN